MKTKKIERFVNKERRIIVADGEECQWMIFSKACYPLYGLPRMGNIAFFAMFDITQDKWSKYYFNEIAMPGNVSFEDIVRGEQVLDRGEIRVGVGGRTLEPLVTSQGIVFIDVQYLVPFSDDDNYELYERTATDGSPYIAVKSGMELLGVILPHEVVDEEFISTLEKLLSLSRVALENQQKRDGTTAEEQMAMEDAGK